MSSRQRMPSGRSNNSSTTTTANNQQQRPLRLTLIPEGEESSVGGHTSSNVGTARTLRDGDTSSRRQISSRLSTQRAVSEAFSSRPWAAPSVQSLTQQLGKNREAHALVVEGREGDVLTAVGSDKDNTIASAVLSRAQQQKHEQRRNHSSNLVGDGTRTLHAGHTPRFPSLSTSHSTGGASSASRRNNRREFGVVYEHRDCFGKPKYIGHTDGVPEKRFLEDAGQHQAVRNLLGYEQGKSEVVWAGTAAASLGGGKEGQSTMKAITQTIVEERALASNLEKLRGPKPYSRHGY